jgi:type III restriction enzyme
MHPPTDINAAIAGPELKLSLDDLRDQRNATVAFHLAGHTLRTWFRDQEDNLKPWLFPSLLAITHRWMAECVRCEGGTFAAYLLWRAIGDKAAERIYRACLESAAGAKTLRPIMDPFNETGSSRFVSFVTTKTRFFTPRADHCQINLVVNDSG